MRESRKVQTPSESLPAPLLLAGGIGGAALCASVLVGGVWSGTQAPFPYLWRDVALVHFLSALPLGASLALSIHRRASAVVSVAAIAIFLGLSVLLICAAVTSGAATPVLRAGPALCLAVSVALAALAACGPRLEDGASNPWGFTAAQWTFGIAFFLLVPSIYVSARGRHDAARLSELLEQSRIGEADVLAQRMLSLHPSTLVGDRPLAQVAADVDRVVSELAARTAAPLVVRATDGERLQRARDLAMLGQNAAVIDVLATSPELSASGEACNLRGTVFESQEEWSAALHWYRQARAAWDAVPPSSQRWAGTIRAVTGIAFCERKSGRYAQAEAAYLELLALAPTADTHFLLATFYEDTQQSAQAQAHARSAMALAPDRRAEGQRILDKLATLHFGCWSVYSSGQGDKVTR